MGQDNSKEKEDPSFIPGIRQCGVTSTNPKRAVFLDSWGRTGVSPVSMHQVILVINDMSTEVSSRTTGTIIDWGARVGDQWVKQGAPARQKPFDFNNEIRKGNSFEFMGITQWTNQQIESLATKLGYKYNVDHNNCRHVACDAIQAITKIPVLSSSNPDVPDDDDKLVEIVAQTVLEERTRMGDYMRLQADYAAMDGAAAVVDIGAWGFGVKDKGRANLQILDPETMGAEHLRLNNP